MASKPSASSIDIAANMGSFAIASALALGANLLVLHFWQQEGMGVFIQSFSIYILATQIGARGTQNATLTFLGRWHHKKRFSAQIIIVSLVLTLLTSLGIGAVIWFFAPLVAAMLQSPLVAETLRAFIPAIVFGSLIKISMAALNGASMLRRYAFLQAFRATAIFAAVIIAGISGATIPTLALYFGMAEATSFMLGLLFLGGVFGRKSREKTTRWIAPISLFGLKTLPYGIIAELNTKIDVLILGIFASDAIVGIYAFAALLAEGFANLVIVFRDVLFPKIAGLVCQGPRPNIRQVFLNWRLRLNVGFFALGAGASVFLWFALPFTPIDIPADQVVIYFCVISAGVVIASAHMPFNTVLMLGGKPGLHSIYFLSVLGANTVGNIILTPLMGALGTAIATGLAYALSAALLIILARRYLGIKLY